MNEVFEVVDASDEERYWPMGIFPTLGAAIFATSGATPDMVPNHSDDDSDCVIIEIRRREFGYSQAGRVVHMITFNREFADEQGEDTTSTKCSWTRTDKQIDQ